MKNHLSIACAIVLILAANYFSKAQQLELLPDGGNVQFSKDTIAEMKSFCGQYNSGSIYLKWLTAKEKYDGVYVIYRSNDGENFLQIGYKQGIGVPIDKDIAYFFTDSQPLFGNSYYRILFIGENKSYLYSSKIEITNDSSSFVANK